MTKKVVVLGATGNLGGKIVQALASKGARVIALVRNDTKMGKLGKLRFPAVDILEVDMANKNSLEIALDGAFTVVSALQGLRDVIVDVQSNVLEAAIDAGVRQFIPSDYSVDFTKIPEGENRNFDLRREFYRIINEKPIQATSIFNGAFADILSHSAPFVDLKNRSIGYWDSADWKVDITTMDDTAEYTAAAALDKTAPRKLFIAGSQISARELKEIAENVFGAPFKLQDLGSTLELSAFNKKKRAENREGENELYPAWQGSQYMHSMFTTHHSHLDNDRYENMHWTDVSTVLSGLCK